MSLKLLSRMTAVFLVFTLLLTGCAGKEELYSKEAFAMDTFITLSAYGKDSLPALDEGADLITQLDNELSVTREGSDIYRINHAQGQWTQVSQRTYDLIDDAVDLCDDTWGALDITAYPAVLAWGFTGEEHRVPSPQELETLARNIDYTAVEFDQDTLSIRLPEGMMLDLGAVAKGWAGDQLAEALREAGVDSALLYLGGNIHTIGEKPDGSPWRLGLQDPDGQDGQTMAAVEVRGRAMVTSGGYQRYFEEDGQVYWHILDPNTAAPARSGVKSATILGEKGIVCDALSTAFFVMGAEDSARFWQKNPQLGVDYILVLEDGSVQISQGLAGNFTLLPGYEDVEVTVIPHE